LSTPNQAGPVAIPIPMEFGPHDRLSGLVHGGAKVGKSTVTATVPKPAVVLDAEGSWRFTSGRKTYWDPITQPPPVYDGTWDICVVHTRSWPVVEAVLAYAQTGQLPFVSYVLDSITVLQKRLKKELDDLKGSDGYKFWGALLDRMDDTIVGFRDLTLVPELPVRCVMFVAETALKDGKWRPSMQGAISNSLPYTVDICGYLYQHKEQDAMGMIIRDERHLWIGLHDQFVSGSRVIERLGQSVLVPPPPPGETGTVITDWMRTLFHPRPVNHLGQSIPAVQPEQ